MNNADANGRLGQMVSQMFDQKTKFSDRDAHNIAALATLTVPPQALAMIRKELGTIVSLLSRPMAELDEDARFNDEIERWLTQS